MREEGHTTYKSMWKTPSSSKLKPQNRFVSWGFMGSQLNRDSIESVWKIFRDLRDDQIVHLCLTILNPTWRIAIKMPRIKHTPLVCWIQQARLYTINDQHKAARMNGLCNSESSTSAQIKDNASCCITSIWCTESSLITGPEWQRKCRFTMCLAIESAYALNRWMCVWRFSDLNLTREEGHN